MSITINSNVAASNSALNMKRANNLLTKSLQRLSSGKRIVSPSDDAGGLAVGMKLQSSLRRTAASRMNTQNGVSFLQMQDGVMKVAGEILDRMSELKSFYNDISKNATDRETYNHEFHELQKELNSLKAQKLNGVSLFASTEGNGTLGISTSDDGLGEKIKLKRTGFFENLKSKFGADSVLNSGSQGSYRQLVGDFSRDGGVNDPKPGNTSRAYGSGEVVYKTGISDADSGYFMATKDVNPGIKISVGGANTNWLKIADKSGNGFVEAFPEAKEFDSFSLKRTSDGRQMSYLKGDVVKVPAHWDSPGSYFYLKAQTDVPYGKTLNDIYNENQVGPSKFFDYVGQNANGIPTTDFVRANANLPDPSLFNPTNATSFINLFNSHLSNNYTPGFVKVDAANDPFLNGGAAPVATGSTKQVTTIKGIAGDMQVKEINIENLFGDQADAFTINVALIWQARAVLGFIVLPVTHELYIGAPGVGAWRCTQDACTPLRVRHLDVLSPLRVLASVRHSNARVLAVLERLDGVCSGTERINAGSAVKFCRLVDAEADIYPRTSPCYEWDVAAGDALVTAAGGFVRNAAGQPMCYNERDTLLVEHFVAGADSSIDWASKLYSP